MKTFRKSLIALCAILSSNICGFAQVPLDTVRHWNFAEYSAATVDNLKADTKHWTYNSKGRYQNAVATDGLPLKANDIEIEETKDVIISAGIPAGSFLLRHAMGANNGMQIQPSATMTLPAAQSGDIVHITFMSSSKSNVGISAVTNLDGEYGSSYYIGPTFREFELKVIEDGTFSLRNSGGIVIKSITLLRERNKDAAQTSAPAASLTTRSVTIHDVVRSFVDVSLTCADTEANIYYSLDGADINSSNAKLYTGPFTATRTCVLKAYAVKDGQRQSEVISAYIDVPFALPYQGKPYVLDPEGLDRGAIVTKGLNEGSYLVNWRMLITDPDGLTFNVLRDGAALNSKPLSVTNYVDEQGSETSLYEVQVLRDGAVIETSHARMLAKGYWDIAINRPEGGSTVSGEYEYVPGDCMVADLDGDSQYEIVMKWDPNNIGTENNDVVGAGQKDNSIYGVTANVLIDAYRLDGTQLWRINLGKNIRAGAHYTQLMVYDLDGDGRAEVACKTAPGTIDGAGKYVLLHDDDPAVDYRNSNGGIIAGPEYLTVFSGTTGEALATTDYLPSRSILSSAEWGDSYGNRCERYLGCVAYLDGEHPSLVMTRGYYTASYLWAVDFDGKELATRWLHVSDRYGMGAYGEGAHSINTADVDGDGCDEIIFGSCAIDNDGTLIYRTGLGHGDALHCGDFCPDRPGLEVMMVHEETSAKYGIEMHDALTGEIIAGKHTGTDVGRGVCADIDPRNRGCEYWGDGNDVYDITGKVVSSRKPSKNFRTYWDGDYYEELTETGSITKWSPDNIATLVNMSNKYGAGTNLIKHTPNLQADIFGDWREEQVYYDNATKSHLYIFSTPYPTEYALPTLMHDHHYRMATVWQTSAYNQPPHLSFYLPDYLESNSGIIDVEASAAEVVAVEYYDLTGRQLTNKPATGFCICKEILSDGTINAAVVRY